MNSHVRETSVIKRGLRGPAMKTRSISPSIIAGLTPRDARDLAESRTSASSRHEDPQVAAWMAQVYRRATLSTERIPLAELDKWRVNSETGNIEHESGRFFTILGAQIRHRHQIDETSWNQPFVDQAEVGILGILAAEFDGVLHVCLQAKEEPGNINSVQLSPTVQATFSNYRRAHGGKTPPLIDLFLNPRPQDVIYSRLQTEDGGRFLFKSNRNMMVRCDPAKLPYLSDHFIWLTLRQVAALLKRDNKINACARSILAAAMQPEGSGDAKAFAHIRDLLGWLDEQKANTHIHTKHVSLNAVADWRMDRNGYFSHKQGRFFRIIGLRVETRDREIAKWTQPILENPHEGIVGLLVQNRAGSRHVLMQAKAEPGNRPPVQLAPTVQFTPSNYRDNVALERPFLFDEFMKPSLGKIISDTRQSEEGARFYREQHLHRIIEIPAGHKLDLPDNYRWFSPDAVGFFLHMGEYMNSCARSILTCLP